MKKTLIALAIVMASGSAMAASITPGNDIGSTATAHDFVATFDVPVSCVVNSLPTAPTSIVYENGSAENTTNLQITSNVGTQPSVKFGAISAPNFTNSAGDAQTLTLKAGNTTIPVDGTDATLAADGNVYTLANVGYVASGVAADYKAFDAVTATSTITIDCGEMATGGTL